MNNKELQKKAIEEAQQEWGRGSVQLKQNADSRKELQELADAPFARTANDPKLERQRKELIRDGDPMADYVQSKKPKHEHENEGKKPPKKISSNKPKYSGPKPPPNRFGIMPGYRWDAVDRGNNVEKQILLKISERSAFDEDKYKWSVADM